MPQARRSQVQFPMSLDFLTDLILPATLPEVDSASNRNGCQEFSWANERLVNKDDNITTICELTVKCGSLDVSQAYGPPCPITGRALPFLFLLWILLTFICNRKFLYHFLGNLFRIQAMINILFDKAWFWEGCFLSSRCHFKMCQLSTSDNTVISSFCL
jgi:hypothetical protein